MFRLNDVAKVLGGTITGGDAEITSVSTDSRTLKPGALFVALDGERFQGSDFLADAERAGAAAVLIRHPGSNTLPGLVVEDTTAALGQLAAHWRARFDIPVIGVTGSNGKTTVKEMIGAIFAESGEVHISPGNFNNHIGVPLALLGLREHHRFAVIEMGMNHPGEIDYLSRLVSPTTALITNAALAHLEGLGSLAGVVRAKAEIFHGLRAGGTAVINTDARFVAYWAARVKEFQTVTFGLKSRARVCGEVTGDSEGQTVEIRLPDDEFEVRLNLLGRHNASNALAAASVGWACGLSPDEIRAGLQRVEAQPGRLQVRAGARGSTLIDDTYNANPTSLKAAIRALAAREGRKTLILGDMAELGTRAQEFHAESGREARRCGIDLLFTCGPLARLAGEAFGEDARCFDSLEDLIKAARPVLSPGLTVLIKGSRSARMEQVADALVCVAEDGAIAC